MNTSKTFTSMLGFYDSLASVPVPKCTSIFLAIFFSPCQEPWFLLLRLDRLESESYLAYYILLLLLGSANLSGFGVSSVCHIVSVLPCLTPINIREWHHSMKCYTRTAHDGPYVHAVERHGQDASVLPTIHPSIYPSFPYDFYEQVLHARYIICNFVLRVNDE